MLGLYFGRAGVVGRKAEKQATIPLQTYAASRNEKDYQAFLDSLSVPLGDRVAREQMEKPEPDYAAIHAGFKQGKVTNADIPGMTVLSRKKSSGGYILVSSEVGIGTTIRVYLPQVKSEANTGALERRSMELAPC